MKDINNYFNREKKRQKYAEINDLKSLREIYKLDKNNNVDVNTKSYWNKLNNRNTVKKKENPMYYDRIEKIYKSINKIKNPNVLDVGYGACDLENKAKKLIDTNSVNWYSLDISNIKLKYFKIIYPKIHFFDNDIRKQKFTKGYFDIIVVSEFLEHIPPRDTFQLLNKFNNILKNDGYLIVTVPLNENLKKIISQKRNINLHVREYTPSLIKAELNISGFSVEKEQYLYAYNSLYKIKSMLSKIIFKYKKPNLIFLECKKKK